MKVTSTTVKNRLDDKPNEDGILVDEDKGLFLVVDGVTRDKIDGIYPNPSPAAKITRLFVEFIKENYKNDLSLSLLFEKGNKVIEEANRNFDHYFKPGVVAVCIKLRENILEWISIGDCVGLLIRENNVVKFNTKQTEKMTENILKFDEKFLRTQICTKPDHPFAYGVMNGDPNAETFFECGSFEVLKGDNVFLFSDGLEMFVDHHLELQLLDLPIEEIIKKAENIEVKHNIRTDDKTFIRIEL